MKKISEYVKENWKIAVGIVLAVTILGAFYWNKKVLDIPKQEEKHSEWAELSKEKEATGKKKEEKEEDENEIVVDVKGAVKKPGIYKLSSKKRVSDAVASAGGFTEEAERKGINLAKKLQDEAEVYVPVRGETDTNHLLETKDNTSKTAETTKINININTADLTELQQLSGVGAKKAQDILDYRSENGSFESVEELTKVSGFGPKTLEKLKEAITVD